VVFYFFEVFYMERCKIASLFAFFLLAISAAAAQQPNQLSLQIDPASRSLTLTADGSITVDPDLAILHIGFTTPPNDSKSVYAAAAQTSNSIIAALKQAGIADADIHSQSQQMQPVWNKPHKFTLTQQWTVDAPPARAAELLDIAITAGATDTGEIDWTMHDLKQLENQALRTAAARVRENAATLADSMGVHLGKLLYTTNQIIAPPPQEMRFMAGDMVSRAAPQALAPPLAIEPHKVTRSATVYAVFQIE